MSRNHESEVEQRLAFESKLNILHAAHRDLQESFYFATDEICEIEKDNKKVNAFLKSQNAELVDLRSSKFANESKIQIQYDKIRHLSSDNEIRRD